MVNKPASYNTAKINSCALNFAQMYFQKLTTCIAS